MKKTELVSIIIPVYNVEKYLEKCLESCLKQSYKNIEIIAVNDGSEDNSANILNQYSEKYKNVKVIHKNNNGVSSARNVGIKESQGEYVIFVDADDYLSVDAVEYMMTIIKNTSSEFAILKNCFTSIEQNQFVDEIKSISNEDALCLLLGLSMELGCWNKMYSRKLLIEKNIYFNENLFYGEGLQFILNVAQNANKIGYGTKSVYYYRKNNLSSATSCFNYNKIENGEKSLIKVKDELKIKTKKVYDTWNLHYIIFAQNAIIQCINNKNEVEKYKETYREWGKKFYKFFLKVLCSKYINLNVKIKLIAFAISPKFFSKIRKCKIKRRVNRSV